MICSMKLLKVMVRVMVFNATFNNISAISWRWRNPERPTDLSQVTDTLSLVMLYRVHLAMIVIRTNNVSGDIH